MEVCLVPSGVSLPEKSRSKAPSLTVAPEKLAFGVRLKDDLKSLVSPKHTGVSAVCVIDPSDRLMQILVLLKGSPQFIDLALANKIHTAMLKFLAKPPFGKGARTILKSSAVSIIRRVLTSTLQAVAVTLSKGKGRTQLENIAKRCLSTSCQCCSISETPIAWKDALEYARDASSILSMSLEAFLSEKNVGRLYNQISSGILEAMVWAVRRGDTANLADLGNLVRRHAEIRQQTNDCIAHLLSERAGSLPDASQEWAMRQLGLEASETRLEYTNPVEAPEVRQAASLLLLLFDEQKRNSEFKEAFERFRGLCEAHFHLFLRGVVGDIVEFDNRLHENTDAVATQVRLIRPWIEWYVPPKARVVIRGIVEACEREREAI